MEQHHRILNESAVVTRAAWCNQEGLDFVTLKPLVKHLVPNQYVIEGMEVYSYCVPTAPPVTEKKQKKQYR